MPISLNILSKFDPKGILNAENGIDRLGSAFKSFALVGVASLAAATAGLGYFAVEALKAADESNRIDRGLQNMISNSDAFGKSTESIKLASKTITDFTQNFALLTGISDETFNSLATTFLAAPEIAKMGADGVNRLIQIAANASAATGKDLESVGTALAKALENPTTAMAKLQRASIFLSDEQKKTYQAMADVGDIAGAQSYLIETLGAKYAGAAEAAASPWNRLKETFEKLKELVGNKLGEALLPIIPLIQSAVEAMIADPAFAQMIAEVAKSFVDMAPSIIELLPSLTEFALVLIPALIQFIPIVTPIIAFLSQGLRDFNDNMKLTSKYTDNAFVSFGLLLGPIGWLVQAVVGFSNFLKDLNLNLGSVIGPVQALFFFFQDLEGSIKRVGDTFRTVWEFITGQTITIPTVLDTQGVRAAVGGLRPMATGGIVTGPTPALVGEAGPEAIIPLDRLGKMGGATYNINVTAGVGDPAAIGQQIVTYIKKFERSGGPVFVSA